MQSTTHVPVIEALCLEGGDKMLDIFRKEPGGGVLWMGTAKDENEVREIFKKFLAANPGVYFTFDESTRTKRTIKPEEFGGDVQP